MTSYGKPKTEPSPNIALKSKEERKKVLVAIRRRRAAVYRQMYQKQRLASKR